MEHYRHRCPLLKQTVGSRRNAAIDDRLAMTGTADQPHWDRRMKVPLESFRRWRTTVEVAVAETRPVVRWSKTIADSGTGADRLRTYLSYSRAQEITDRGGDGEDCRPTTIAVEVQARCVKGRKDRRRYLKGR